MNFGPKSFDLRSNGVYVIIETLPDVAFSSKPNYKVIGAAHSLETAKRYDGPNRTIKGPVPLFDADISDPTPNPFKPGIFPIPNNPDIFPPNINPHPVFNPFDPPKPVFDFGLPTKPFYPLHDNNNNSNSMDLI